MGKRALTEGINELLFVSLLILLIMAFYIKDSHRMIGCDLKIKKKNRETEWVFSVKINTIFLKILFNLILWFVNSVL